MWAYNKDTRAFTPSPENVRAIAKASSAGPRKATMGERLCFQANSNLHPSKPTPSCRLLETRTAKTTGTRCRTRCAKTNSAPRLQTRCGIELIQCKLYSTTQFSILSPFTCEKCCVLLVTKIASIDFAAAAISMSNAPIGVPSDSNCARTSA